MKRAERVARVENGEVRFFEKVACLDAELMYWSEIAKCSTYQRKAAELKKLGRFYLSLCREQEAREAFGMAFELMEVEKKEKQNNVMSENKRSA